MTEAAIFLASVLLTLPAGGRAGALAAHPAPVPGRDVPAGSVAAGAAAPAPAAPRLERTPVQGAEPLARRVAAVGTGTARMSFATDPDVCGDGGHAISRRRDDTDGWTGCDRGPARVSLTVRRGRVTGVRVHVGGHWLAGGSGVTDMGRVSAVAAARYLLGLVPMLPERAARSAMVGAVIADSARVGPDLERLARDRRLSTSVRKTAIFWLGQSDAPLTSLTSLYRSMHGETLRAQVIFALSQRSEPGALDALIRIARHERDRALRRKAIFWLGQSRDPRALDTLRAMITG